MEIMFKCPKCSKKLTNMKCKKCDCEIPYNNGVYLGEDQRYIGYDEINLDFEPALIYWPDRSCKQSLILKYREV